MIETKLLPPYCWLVLAIESFTDVSLTEASFSHSSIPHNHNLHGIPMIHCNANQRKTANLSQQTGQFISLASSTSASSLHFVDFQLIRGVPVVNIR